MKKELQVLLRELQHKHTHYWNSIKNWANRNGVKITIMGIGIFLFTKKDVSIQFQLNGDGLTPVVEQIQHLPVAQKAAYQVSAPKAQADPMNVSMVQSKKIPTNTVSDASNSSGFVQQLSDFAKKMNLANTYSNMTFSGKAYTQEKEDKKGWDEKRLKQEAYVNRFSKIAKEEMQRYGIPASIKLAQGLIESNCGESRLSTQNHNHFGMKCFSRTCKKGHCSNFTDDSHKDFFRKYESAWDSYRSHSEMLKGSKRYASLFKLRPNDYKSWAYGLKKAGYATDKHYAEKLIELIERLSLHRFD